MIARTATTTLALILSLLWLGALAGCEQPPEHEHDICLQREVFNECMAALPAGPVRAHYNDWSEVVEACHDRSHWISLRRVRDIPAGCR